VEIRTTKPLGKCVLESSPNTLASMAAIDRYTRFLSACLFRDGGTIVSGSTVVSGIVDENRVIH